MKYKVQVDVDNYGYISIDADNAKDAYKKVKDLINIRQNNLLEYNKDDSDIENLIEYSDNSFISCPDNCQIINENGELYLKDGIKYTEYLDSLYENEDENTLEFIWGIVSSDDFSSQDGIANEHTMNDLTIWYDKKDKEFFLEIEEIYYFEPNQQRGQQEYLHNLCYLFKNYLIKECNITEEELNNYNSNLSFSPSEILKDTVSLRASTLVDLYRNFYLFVMFFDIVVT